MASYYAAPAPYDPYAQAYGAPPPAYGAPPPAYGAPPPHYGAPGAMGEEIRTIFITGFPNDVKERELNNMLRFLPGYVASQMNWKNNQAQGFALFESAAAAQAACGRVAGVQFDETAVLRCEIARKNMFTKEADAMTGTASAKRPRYDAAYGGAAAGGYTAPPPVANQEPIIPVQPITFAPVTNIGDNPPCNTLFVGNLGDTVNEQELRGLFGSQPGFVQLKMNRAGKALTCFVEYADLASAMAVHQNLQGAVISTSDRGGMRIQYSRNPFGKRKDAPM